MRPTTAAIEQRHQHGLIAKYLTCLVESNGSEVVAARIAERKCPAMRVLPEVFHQRAAVGAMPLGTVDPFDFAPAVFRALLVSDLAALLARFTKVPARTKVPTENSGGAVAGWNGQGLPPPVLKSVSATTTLDVFQMQALTVLTKELFRFETTAEKFFMSLIRDAVSRYFASALFDNTLSATSARPAALTNGAGFVTSTGTTSAQMTTDLNNLIANVYTAQEDLAWCMRPKTFYRIAATLGGAGLNVSKSNLFGIPVTFLSGMPREVVLVDCASVLYASDEQAELSISTETTLEMSDSPSSSGISGTGASLVSMYQAGLVAVQAVLTASWANAFMLNSSPNVPSGICYMTTAY
jgi:hypothetical protein